MPDANDEARGELTRKRAGWFVSTERAHAFEPGAVVTVASPTGLEALVRLVYRVHSVRYDRELWVFEILITRPQGSTNYDRAAQRVVWDRELERLSREAPVTVFRDPPPRKRRRRRRRKAPTPPRA